MRRRHRALAALLSLLVMAGCTSPEPTQPQPDPDASSPATAPGSPDPEPARELWNDTRFDRLTDAEFDDLALLSEDEDQRLGAYDDAGGYAAPVFGDDVIVLLPETQLLTVLDRETAEVLWQQRLPELRDYPTAPKEPQELCRVAQLPPGATVLTVLLGRRCSTFLHYDLANGDLLGQEQKIGELGVSETTPTFSVARETYWLDGVGALYRFDGAGGSQQVLAPSVLGLDPDKEVPVRAMVINGTDVAVIKLLRYGPEAPNSGRFVGIRVSAPDQAEVAWSQRARTAIRRAQPSGPYFEEEAVLLPEFQGHLFTAVEKGIRTPRLNRFDPETGALDSGIVLERDPLGGFPAWAAQSGVDNLLPLDDGILAASGLGNSSGRRDVTLYDYTTGRIRWSHRAVMGKDFGVARADPVGVSTDGAHYYVAVSGDYETVLLELDAATGKETRRWEFTIRVTSYLNNFLGLGLEVVIHGDRMVWLARSVGELEPYFAAVFALPEVA